MIGITPASKHSRDINSPTVRKFDYSSGDSALHTAIRQQEWEKAAELIKKGADIYAKNDQGVTPLHLAAALPKTNVLQQMAVQLAAKEKTTRSWFSRLLLDWEFDFSIRDNQGETPLHIAAQNSSSDVLQFLFKSTKPSGRVIDFLNKKGYSPLHKAVLANQSVNVKTLLAQGADFNLALNNGSSYDPTLLSMFIAQVISQPNFGTGKPTEQESWIAKLSGPVSEFITQEHSVSNVLHLCTMHLNYRMALILLHPLSLEQRKKLCSAKNEAGKTPLMQLEESFAFISQKNTDPAFKEHFDKFKRLLLRYDQAAYLKEVSTIEARLQFQFQLTQDKRHELMASQGYSYASNAMLYGLPIWAFGSAYATTGFAFCGLEAACSAYFGVDVYDKAERIIQQAQPYLPKSLQAPLTWTQRTLNWAGWYRNTSMRIGAEVIRQGGAYALSNLDSIEHGLGSKNYFTHTNMAGALFYTAEEVGGRRIVGSYLQSYIPSVESLMKDIGVPTLNEMTAWAGDAVNTAIENKLGINLKDTIVDGYYYFRKEYGGVKPTQAQLALHFNENLADTLKEKFSEQDPEVVKVLLEGAEVIFARYYDDPESLQSQMNDWVSIGIDGLLGNTNYDLLDSVVSNLVANGANYGDVVGKILLQPHVVDKYQLGADYVQQKQRELSNTINTNHEVAPESVATKLSDVVDAIIGNFDTTYLQTRKSGQESVNDYNNKLRTIFGHEKYKSTTGRAAELSWAVIENHPFIFSQMTSAQRKECAEELEKQIYAAQDGHSGHEQRAVDYLDRLNVFFGSIVLNKSFSNKNRLNPTTHAILNQYDAVEARAAFAVQHVQDYLGQSAGYVPLSFKDQLVLYSSVIKAHSAGSLTRAETAIHNHVWDALQSHAIDKSNYELIAGQYTLDEAANHVFVTSRDAAEGRWTGSTEAETRVVKVQQDSGFTRMMNFFKEHSSGSVGAGAQTNGSQAAFGRYDFSNNQLTPFVQFGFAPTGKYDFVMPHRESSSSSSSSSAYDMTALVLANGASQARTPFETLWNNTLDNVVADHIRLPTEQDYLDTFIQTVQSHHQQSLGLECNGIFECGVRAVGAQFNILHAELNQAIEMVKNHPELIEAERVKSRDAQKAQRLQHFESEMARLGSSKEVFLKCISITGSKAHAFAPAVILLPEAVFFASAVFTAYMAIKLENKMIFPIHQEYNDGYLPGGYADPELTGPTTLVTPLDGPNIPSRFETPINQPGPDSGPLIFPAHPHQILAYCYSKWKENNNTEVELFRAVTKPEYEQIKKTGNFQGIGNDLKFFARTLDEAKLYANKERTQEYVIVSTKTMGRIKESDQAYVDGGINAVVFRDKDLYKLSPPTMVDQGALLKDYVKQAEGKVMKLPGTYTGFTYDHSKQNFRDEASSAIPNQQTGQRLIDSGYINLEKPDQLFNYYQNNVIRFEINRNGIWQSNIVENNVDKAVGTNVLKEFRSDGLISNAEYKKLLKM